MLMCTLRIELNSMYLLNLWIHIGEMQKQVGELHRNEALLHLYPGYLMSSTPLFSPYM